MPKIIIGILLLLCSSNCIEANHNNKINFLRDFLNKQAPSHQQILLSFCNKKESIIQFSKLLNNFYKHKLVKNAQYLPAKNEIFLIILLEMQCPESMNILLEAHSLHLFTETNYWLIFTASLPESLYFPINSNVFQINNNYSIKVQFKQTPTDQKFIKQNIGQWTPNSNFKYFKKLFLPTNRSNFMRKTFKISYYYTHNETLAHLTDFRQQERDNILKLNYIILSHLADYLNATFESVFTPHLGMTFNASSGLAEAGTMIGDVQRGIADVMGVAAFMDEQRLKFLRFFGSTNSETIKFIFIAPSISSIENVYARTFDWLTWYCIAILSIVVPVLFFVISQEEKWIYSNHHRDNNIVTFAEAIMITFSALTQKSWEKTLNSSAGKFAIFVVYMAFLILFNAHCAGIIMFSYGTTNSIKTFENLYNSKFEIGVHNLSYNRYYFLFPNERTNEYWRNKLHREVYLKKGDENFFFDLDKAVELIGSKMFAFHGQLGLVHLKMNEKFTQSQKCSVRYVNTIYQVSHIYMAARKNASFLSHFKVGLARIYELGLYNRAFKRLFAVKLPCEGHINHFTSLGLAETRYLFAVFIFLVFTSFAMLLLEIVLWKFVNSLICLKLLKRFKFVYDYTE